MFKAARWRSEKNRIKAVFKLQFKATQVPQTGWEAMMVTLVPMDVGKPTQISEKATVIDGACHWVNPIYETVKLTQDLKTGKINKKLYQCLVSSTGSAKSGVLGEVTINLADYAEDFKAFSVSLPLQALNTGATLHVTVQRMQGDVEGRETNENGGTTVKQQRRTLKSQFSNPEIEEGGRVPNGTDDINSAEEGSVINSQAQVKFHSCRNMPLHADSSVNLRKSSSFDAISASGSESSSGQYTPKENGIKHKNAHQDNASFLSPLSNSDTPRNTDWSVSSAPDGSIGESTNSSGDNGLRERVPESDNALEKQKSDLVALARQLEVSELELQTLRKQVVKESRRGQDLSMELSSLKEERDALRRECEELKASKKRVTEDETISAKLQFRAEDPWSMIEEMKEELNHEKNLNANLRLQLQKTQESNSELIFAVRDLEELLEQKRREMSCINEDSRETEFGNQLTPLRNSELKQGSVETIAEHKEEEQYALNVLVKERDDVKVAYSQEQKIRDYSELELCKKDCEDLEMQMEQLALDYEILKQENHDISSRLEQTQLREQLRMQYECSAHLAIINDLEAHVESLEEELDKQAEAFEANLETIRHAKVEQEKRAIQAEEVLRKTRWNNANTAEQLQEEFKRLSAQMTTTFYANEKLVMKAITESRELRWQKCHLEELLEKSNEELASVQHQHQVKCQQLLTLIDFKTKEADMLFLELKDKREELDNLKKSEEARQKASKEEILVLKAEMEQLSREKSRLSEQIEQKEKWEAEIEKLKTSTKEIEMLLQERNLERDMLGKELALMKEEANKSLEELNAMRHLKDEQDAKIKTLNSNVGTLSAQYTDLKHSLFDDELVKENLKKQVFLLRGDLRKEADLIANIEKKLKDNNAKLPVSEGITKTTIRNNSKRSVIAAHGSQEVSSLNEESEFLEVNLLNGHNRDTHEDEQDKSTKFEQSGIAHLQQNFRIMYKIQEDNSVYKNIKSYNTKGVKINGDYLQETRKGDKAFTNHSNDFDEEQITSNIGVNSKKEEESVVSCTCDQRKIAEVLSEMAELKVRNESMEAELKEMQERYSEISLKFAEVEGERQQLVITIRTLKNALKN